MTRTVDIPAEYRPKILRHLEGKNSLAAVKYDSVREVFTKRVLFISKDIPREEVFRVYQQILQEEKKNSTQNFGGDNYWVGAFIAGTIIFIIVWIYSMAEWGFLLGIVFGWLPAIIAALIGGFLWPLVALLLIGVILLVLWPFF